MNKNRKVMASLVLAYFCFSSFASDHVPTISPGDVVSADVLRESLDEAANTMSKTKIDDFLGTWEANQSVCIGGSASIEGNGLCDAGVVFDGDDGDEKLFPSRKDTWNIVKESNSRISLQSDSYNFLFNPAFGYLVPNDPVVWACELAGSEILVCLGPEDNLTYRENSGCATNLCRLHVMMNVRRYSDNEISLMLGPIDTSIANNVGNKFGLFNVVELTRRGVIPAPAFLRVEVEIDKVTVSWSFSEDSEAQFEIFRKDSLNGIYENIGLASEMFYEDEGLGSGDYWYRVYATSEEKRSRGSNVRKVTIEE